MTKRHVFLDTMMYLHYRPVEEVDWPGRLSVDEVTIVVPAITVQELDEHKNSHRSRKIQDRARTFLAKLEKWTEADGTVIRERTYIRHLPPTATGDAAALGLNPKSHDDVLLATIVEYKKQEPDVVLISADSGPRLNARHLHISTFTPPDDTKLPEEPDPQEKEIADLRRQVQKMQNALPLLTAQFLVDGKGCSSLTFKLSTPEPLPEEAVSSAVAEVRKRLPPCDLPPKDRSSRRAAEKSSLTFITMLTGEDEYVRYNRDLETYFLAYAAWMRKKAGWQDARRRSVVLLVAVVNTGSAPADDVDVILHFPNGMRLWGPDTIPKEPAEPDAPVHPRVRSLIGMESIARTMRPRSPLVPALPQVVGSPLRIRETDSYEVTFKFARVKHGECAGLPPLCVEFHSFDTASSFGIDYEVRPANLPNPVRGTLHVIVEKNTG